MRDDPRFHISEREQTEDGNSAEDVVNSAGDAARDLRFHEHRKPREVDTSDYAKRRQYYDRAVEGLPQNTARDTLSTSQPLDAPSTPTRQTPLPHTHSESRFAEHSTRSVQFSVSREQTPPTPKQHGISQSEYHLRQVEQDRSTLQMWDDGEAPASGESDVSRDTPAEKPKSRTSNHPARSSQLNNNREWASSAPKKRGLVQSERRLRQEQVEHPVAASQVREADTSVEPPRDGEISQPREKAADASSTTKPESRATDHPARSTRFNTRRERTLSDTKKRGNGQQTSRDANKRKLTDELFKASPVSGNAEKTPNAGVTEKQKRTSSLRFDSAEGGTAAHGKTPATVPSRESRVSTEPTRTMKLTEHRESRSTRTSGHDPSKGPAKRPSRDKAPSKGSSKAHEQQKRGVKKKYAAKKCGSTKAASAKNGAKAVEESGKKVIEFVTKHGKTIALGLLIALLVVGVAGGVYSLFALLLGGFSSAGGSMYTTTDAEMTSAEAYYASKEAALQTVLNTYESTHSYDEYIYNLDAIGHDPYVLIAILTAQHGPGWMEMAARSTMDNLFNRQYTLSQSLAPEQRTRQEQRYDPQSRQMVTVDVEYTYTICTVTLRNNNLARQPAAMFDEEHLSSYADTISTLIHRTDLFPAAIYPNASQLVTPTVYGVSSEALQDERFATMLEEAERYMGYPFVYGGYDPKTSFDSAGFVSWVVNNSGVGWSFGNKSASGLLSLCTRVTAANVKPGDLVFFQGTDGDTTGATHVGIYVGENMMLTAYGCVQYANIQTTYWQSHFLTYARLPNP